MPSLVQLDPDVLEQDTLERSMHCNFCNTAWTAQYPRVCRWLECPFCGKYSPAVLQ